jgi:hypothetical protein
MIRVRAPVGAAGAAGGELEVEAAVEAHGSVLAKNTSLAKSRRSTAMVLSPFCTMMAISRTMSAMDSLGLQRAV